MFTTLHMLVSNDIWHFHAHFSPFFSFFFLQSLFIFATLNNWMSPANVTIPLILPSSRSSINVLRSTNPRKAPLIPSFVRKVHSLLLVFYPLANSVSTWGYPPPHLYMIIRLTEKSWMKDIIKDFLKDFLCLITLSFLQQPDWLDDFRLLRMELNPILLSSSPSSYPLHHSPYNHIVRNTWICPKS